MIGTSADYAAFAATSVVAKAILASPAGRREEALGRNRARAARSFPNDEGNYRGKRTPKPAPRPLTAKERFYKLAAAFIAFRTFSRKPADPWLAFLRALRAA